MVGSSVVHKKDGAMGTVKKAVASFMATVLVATGVALPRAEAHAADSGGYVVASSRALLQAQADDYDISWYADHESPYTITGLKQLKGLSYLVNQGIDTFEGKTVQLADSRIVFSTSSSIEPIGTAEHPFNGTFDGQGAIITNLMLDIGERLSNIGLFGYAGDAAKIENLRLQSGSVEVSNSAAGKTISNVGAIAGHLGGSMEDCISSAAVTVTNNGKVPVRTKVGKTAAELCTVLNVGGLVGDLGGDLLSCVHSGSTVTVNSSTDMSEYVPYIAGYVGGLAGHQGDEADAARVTETRDCHNRGPIAFNISGASGLDRFKRRIYSQSTMVGGIVGYSMGNFADCTNEAEIQTGIVKDGAIQAGWGASTTGGIVGSLRGPTVAIAASATGIVGSSETDPGYSVWTESKGTNAPSLLSIERCSNTGHVVGLASVGGIAGSTGAFTVVAGCANAGKVDGTRWNKPCPAGIVGISNGDIRFCSNIGRIETIDGGGYYASGIAGLLSTYNQSGTDARLLLDVPELCGCYVTGNIVSSKAGYRAAVLVGENDGYIHDNCFLPDLTLDKVTDKEVFGDDGKHSALVAPDENHGTVANSNHELTASVLRSGLGISYLNQMAANGDDWMYYYVTNGDAGGYPLLNWQEGSVAQKNQLSEVVASVALSSNPSYSAGSDPVPLVALSSKDGKRLYQNADYRVIPQSGARAVSSSNVYLATIVGMNGYEGVLSQKVPYAINQYDIASCKITASTEAFNWEQQKPSWVKIFDDAGNPIPESEYTWSLVDPDETNVKADKDKKYHDYVNVHTASYRYDIKVTANAESASYVGEATQPAFHIEYGSLMYSPEGTGNVTSAVYDKVVWDGEEWEYGKALSEKGYVKIKYTGKPIRPTIANPTYLGRPLRDGTDASYWKDYLSYDYRYIYGNPNPEALNTKSTDYVDATGSAEEKLAVMTIRNTSNGNFTNYSNIFFEITPADISSDVAISGIAKSVACTTAGAKVSPKLTYNGMTLKAGSDYKLTYSNNKKVGIATVTIKGKGNYSGSVTKTFKVTKGAQPMIVKTSAKRAAASKMVSPITVKKAQGKVTFKNVSNGTAKKFKVGSKGAIAVPANMKAGVYRVRVKVSTKGNANYKAGSKTVTAKIVVK